MSGHVEHLSLGLGAMLRMSFEQVSHYSTFTVEGPHTLTNFQFLASLYTISLHTFAAFHLLCC